MMKREEVARSLKKWSALMMLGIYVLALVVGLPLKAALAQEPQVGTPDQTNVTDVMKFNGVLVIAIAILVAAGSIAAAYAVAQVGSAALGAVTERPEMMGRAIIFLGLAEGIAIYGLLMAILLYLKLG